jgi:hypothetical protein
MSYKCPQGSGVANLASLTPESRNIFLYTRSDNSVTFSAWSTVRLSFYSIGESLNLEALDNRIRVLMYTLSHSVTYDTDAQAYITAVETADGQPLEVGVKVAIDELVVGFKKNTIWSNAVQLILPCGPRTLAGALVPLKGTAPTNSGFVFGDYTRKTGLSGNGSSKYLNSNVLLNSLPGGSHALAWHGSINDTSGDKSLIGAYETTEPTLVVLDSWAAYVSGRAFRSASYGIGNFPLSTSTASLSCMIGARTTLNSATLYVDGAAISNAKLVSPTLPARTLHWFALNSAGTPSNYSASRLAVGGIYSAGLNATQAAAYRAIAATYTSAIAAILP